MDINKKPGNAGLFVDADRNDRREDEQPEREVPCACRTRITHHRRAAMRIVSPTDRAKERSPVGGPGFQCNAGERVALQSNVRLTS
ncbi:MULTISPECIES: hypothetical protein [unclassified Xanthomonas]|uniref:hypothetical protein n=1 Tax=unclassified Xanthomonas TaxID=2643310 RepID=UPI000F8C5927|nr:MULTISPECIES: hypothetical protein [unclassified Xanthomonas]